MGRAKTVLLTKSILGYGKAEAGARPVRAVKAKMGAPKTGKAPPKTAR